MAKHLMLLYPRPGRALRALLRDAAGEWHSNGLWVVEAGETALFTVDLDGASLTVWPDEPTDNSARTTVPAPTTVPLYGLFAVAGEPFYARVDLDRDGVLTGIRSETVRTIRPCMRSRRLDPRPGPFVRWRVERTASHLPPPWRLAPAHRDCA